MTKAAHAPVASHGVTFLPVAASEVSKYAFLSTLEQHQTVSGIVVKTELCEVLRFWTET